ncbi:hypothetical protein D3C71_2183450 [compost metagenome]
MNDEIDRHRHAQNNWSSAEGQELKRQPPLAASEESSLTGIDAQPLIRAGTICQQYLPEDLPIFNAHRDTSLNVQ